MTLYNLAATFRQAIEKPYYRQNQFIHKEFQIQSTCDPV